LTRSRSLKAITDTIGPESDEDPWSCPATACVTAFPRLLNAPLAALATSWSPPPPDDSDDDAGVEKNLCKLCRDAVLTGSVAFSS
jgi:hypothetical protein